MPTSVALLRGVNVGGSNAVPMAALRAALEGEGFTRVRTYIQSGNVFLDHGRASRTALSTRVGAVITREFGVTVPVIVVSAAELDGILAADPHADEPDDRRVHVIFLPAPLDAEASDRVAALADAAAARGARDAVTVTDLAMYLHTPDGFGTSELAKALSTRGPGAHRAGTARNRATVRAIAALCRA